jgi:hypothetical protein
MKKKKSSALKREHKPENSVLLHSYCDKTERNGDLGCFTLQYEQDYVLSGPRQSSIMFSFIGF